MRPYSFVSMMCRRASLLPAGLLLILGFFTAAVAVPTAAPAESVPTQVTLEIFTRAGCPHCEEAKQFLVDLQRDRPDVQIVLHDILQDASALQRLRDLSAQRGVGTPGVPAFYLQGELIIGYAGPETTGARLRALVDQSRPSSVEPGVPPSTCLPDENPSCAGEASRAIGDTEAVEIPLFGYRLSAHQLGLPLFTFALGLLDGFNPCSMWVLILVVSLLASLKDRLKMMLIAGTFVAVEGIAYFAFMAAWLNLFLFIGLSRISEIILGGVACVAGMVNLKDFWAFSWGLSLSIPKTAKPGLYARLRRILQAENLTGALVGAAVLAVLVQLVELLCTMGFPALYTRILTQRQFDRWTYYGYLVLYNLAYMLDDVLVLAIGVVTLSQRRLQEKEGRWLKLLSGLVMIGLGIYLIVAPYWLNS